MEKYEKFFDFIKEILEKQQAQKLRGLNDYNMLNVVRNEYEEVGMHSNVIYSLLDPNGLHYQNDLFLNLFVEKVLGFELKAFGKISEVQVEEQTDKNRRIDFTIKSENYFIGIEMKVNAGDLENQIFDYYNYLKEEADNKKVIIYYLTKDGKDASIVSKKNIPIEKISFKEHILKWLNSSQHEVQNITNLNMALENYKNIVEKITNKYKGRIVSLSDILKNDEENYKIALEVAKNLKEMRKESIDNFFKDIINRLKNRLGNEWEITLIEKNSTGLATQLDIPLKIYKKSWIGENKLIFGFEFNDNNYYNGTLGIFRTTNKIDIKNDIYPKFKNSLNIKFKFDTPYLHWKWVPDIEGIDDFVEYIYFHKNAKEEFIDEIYNIIEIFEIKSTLITKINDYLKNKATK